MSKLCKKIKSLIILRYVWKVFHAPLEFTLDLVSFGFLGRSKIDSTGLSSVNSYASLEGSSEV
jgi:hypothetical protein